HADHRADFGRPGRDIGAAHRHAHRPVVAPQVARVRAGREVHPLPDVAVAQKPLVVLVRVAEDDAALDLAADAALRAERGPGPDTGAVQHRPGPDRARPFGAG